MDMLLQIKIMHVEKLIKSEYLLLLIIGVIYLKVMGILRKQIQRKRYGLLINMGNLSLQENFNIFTFKTNALLLKRLIIRTRMMLEPKFMISMEI